MIQPEPQYAGVAGYKAVIYHHHGRRERAARGQYGRHGRDRRDGEVRILPRRSEIGDVDGPAYRRGDRARGIDSAVAPTRECPANIRCR